MTVAFRGWRGRAAAVLMVVASVPTVVVIRTVSLDRAVAYLKEGRYDSARLVLTPFAYAGDRTAQLLIGYALASVPGKPAYRSRAVRWFRRSTGLFKSDSRQVAASLFGIAQDYAHGGEGITENHREAVEWLKLAAEEGSVSACEELSRAYSEGNLGLPIDRAQSDLWRRRATTGRTP